MKVLKAIGLYALGVILGGALLAPWLFWGSGWLAGHISWLAWLGDYPFRRVFDRAFLLAALAGLWPLLRCLGYRSWAELGFARSAQWWRHLGLGFVLGIASLVVAIGVARRPLHVDKPAAAVIAELLRLLLTAGVVGLIEETFFRGGLQGALQRGLGLPTAWIASSVIYAAAHFLQPVGGNIEAAAVVWHSGFDWLGRVVAGSFAGSGVGISFVSLVLAGGLLGWAFARTRALYLSIGLHAGWVLPNEFARWLGAGKIIQSPVTWPVLAVLGAVLWWLFRRGTLTAIRSGG